MKKNEKVIYCDQDGCTEHVPESESAGWGALSIDVKGQATLGKADLCPTHIAAIPQGETRKRPGKKKAGHPVADTDTLPE